VILLGLFCGLVWRLYRIQVVDHAAYYGKAVRQHTQTVRTPAERGTIYASDGVTVLAADRIDRSVCVDPGLVPDDRKSETLMRLATLLDLAGEGFEKIHSRFFRENNRYVVLKKDASASEARAVKELGCRAVFVETRWERIYQKGVFASALLGCAGPDRDRSGNIVIKGREGIEAAYNHFLSGTAGLREYYRDAKGRSIAMPGLKNIESVPGADIVLTIDVVVQSIVEEELDAVVEEYRPESAVAIVLDARTNKVLAMVNRPTFDPNDYGRPGAARNNIAVTCVYEPGSTFKPFIVGPALNEGVVTPGTSFNCHQGTWRVGRRKISDVHGYGWLSTTDVIVKSSNIGAVQVGLKLGKEKMWDYLKRFGFGSRTDVGLPGESGGVLRPAQRWHHQDTVSTSFGYAVAVTPLQLVTAFSVYAAGGVLRKPFIIERISGGEGVVLQDNEPEVIRQVVGRKTAEKMVNILTEVVERGTGRKAKSKKYKIAGKTGTAHIALPGGGYAPDRHNATFLAFAPASNPRIVLVVTARAPKGAHYGGVIAAPAAGKIIERVLSYYRVQPDK
jgi:cell division protein FtsI (penicillin-binding protein 3)